VWGGIFGDDTLQTHFQKLALTPFFKTARLFVQNIFLDGELDIILTLRSLEIGKHYSFLNF